jgi:cytochrome c oxidase assembly factor CtaG
VEWPLEVTGFVPALVAAYLFAARRDRPSRARVAAFAAAVALIVGAFATRLEPLALHDFLWAHLLQNVVLAEWAPALLVLSLPPRFASRVRVPPLLALPVWLAVYMVWHLPWLYDLALRHPHSLLHVEHLSYLIVGCLFWWPVIRGEFAAGAKAAYLFAAFVLASPLGLMLALLPRAVYDTYKAAAPTWGLSAPADQQIAGVTMAVEQAIVLFAVFTRFFVRFLSEEERAGALDELRPRSGSR